MEVRHADTSIKVNICFEMSGAYLQMATLMQDYAPLKMMAEEKVCYVVTFVLKLSVVYSKRALFQKGHCQVPWISDIRLKCLLENFVCRFQHTRIINPSFYEEVKKMIVYICFGIGSERNISPTNEVIALQ